MATDFSALSDDLIIFILDKLSPKRSSPFYRPSKFAILAAFSRVSRQCARACRARGWERACKRVFPALDNLFPEGSKVHWAALARLLSWFPGHGVNKGPPRFRVEKCNPKALARRPCRVYPFKVISDWEESLKRGAGILGPWIARGKPIEAVHVFLQQRTDCLDDRFYNQTGPVWEFNSLTIFWGFVAGFECLKQSGVPLQETSFACPFCPSLMLQIPADFVAKDEVKPGCPDPEVSGQIEPEMYVCNEGHLYGFAATDSINCRYDCDWTCDRCGGRPYPGQPLYWNAQAHRDQTCPCFDKSKEDRVYEKYDSEYELSEESYPISNFDEDEISERSYAGCKDEVKVSSECSYYNKYLKDACESDKDEESWQTMLDELDIDSI